MRHMAAIAPTAMASLQLWGAAGEMPSVPGSSTSCLERRPMSKLILWTTFLRLASCSSITCVTAAAG